YFLRQFTRFAGQGFDAFGELGFLGALRFHLVLHAGNLFGGGAFLSFGDLQLGRQLLLLIQNSLITLSQAGQLLLKGGRFLDFLFNLRLHGGELFFGQHGFGGAALKLLIERLQVGLGGGVLLLQIGLFLLQFLRLLFLGLEFLLGPLDLFLALAQQRLLPSQFLSDMGQFTHDLGTAFAFFFQCQAHDGGPIFACLGWLVGGQLEFERSLGLLIRDFVNVDGGERQQADQQKIANDNENGSIHDGVAKEGRAPGATGSSVMLSASSRSFRRAGRRLKILKKETKMIPNEVEE